MATPDGSSNPKPDIDQQQQSCECNHEQWLALLESVIKESRSIGHKSVDESFDFILEQAREFFYDDTDDSEDSIQTNHSEDNDQISTEQRSQISNDQHVAQHQEKTNLGKCFVE